MKFHSHSYENTFINTSYNTSHLSSWGVWGIVSFIRVWLLVADDDDLWFSSRSPDWLRALPALTSLRLTFFAYTSLTADVFTWSRDLVRQRRPCFFTESVDLFRPPRLLFWLFLFHDDGLFCWLKRPAACVPITAPSLLSLLAMLLTTDCSASSLHKSTILGLELYWY